MDEWIYLVGALAGGFLLGVAVILPFALRRRARARSEVATAATREDATGAVPLEIIADEEDHPFTIVKSRAPMRGVDPPQAPVPESAIPMEWGTRHEGGAAPPGRVRGVCSGCGTKLTVSNTKPLRIACPVCGRTRLLT